MILRVFPLLEIKHITDLNVYAIDFVVLIISISDISIDLIATTFQTTQERSCERENTGACVSFHCFVEHKKNTVQLHENKIRMHAKGKLRVEQVNDRKKNQLKHQFDRGSVQKILLN